MSRRALQLGGQACHHRQAAPAACSAGQRLVGSIQHSPVRGKPTVALVEWLTVIAAGGGLKHSREATGGLAATISERRMAWCGRIGPYQLAVDPGHSRRSAAVCGLQTWHGG